jgi:T4 bacteriophage base plate protein
MTTKIILPTYVTKQPSNDKQVKFRPFNVKEEKSLLLALQEGSIETTTEAIKNVIRVCTNETVDPDTVPYYDVEFLFLQIRAKSIGEVIDLVGSCECDPKKKTEFSVDIGDVEVLPTPTGNSKIKIPDTEYTIEFRHPSIDDFAKTYQAASDSAEQVVANCIVTVFTDDEVMNWSALEKLDFVESMTTKQQKDISVFLKNMPMVKLPAKYTCKGCGSEHNTPISGFANFFV